MVKLLDIFDPQITRVVADVIGQTEYPGLSGSNIERRLQLIGVTYEPVGNKRDRLFNTLRNVQARQKCGNALGAFVARALSPSEHTEDPERFYQLQEQLNAKLAAYGYSISDGGKLQKTTKAETMQEVEVVAARLHTELKRRGTHPELLKYCEVEVLQESLFHAMVEAAKSVSDRIRRMVELTEDGADLFNAAFSFKNPRIIINSLVTTSEQSAQRGFLNLLTGIHGHFRNPRAHSTRFGSEEDRQEMLEAFGLFSYVHGVLDRSTVIKF